MAITHSVQVTGGLEECCGLRNRALSGAAQMLAYVLFTVV